MSNLTTEMIQALLNPASANEFFRFKLEETINELLRIELSAFLGYEKHSSEGWNTGNRCNGSYHRALTTQYGDLDIEISRDRKSEFHSPLIPKNRQHVDALETTVIQLYRKGVTTRQIADLIEQMYGHYYSPATVSKITMAVSEQIEAFHSRPIAARYAIIYCDATYLNLRRDSVAKEALHVMLGITPEGNKEVLDYAIYPSESAANYAEMLQGLKSRGLEEVLIFVSDGLVGLPDAVKSVFPRARHQSCWVHLATLRIPHGSSERSKRGVLDALKKVYRQKDK